MAERTVREPTTENVATAPGDLVMERFGRIEEMGRSFDLAYWQQLGDAAIYRAAWELVELHHRDQGGEPHELRLQRTVEAFQRR